jgi:tRNA pseudouridine38-40 synthase
MTVRRWRLTIEYDGRSFHGWQRQETGIASVQETVEQAITAFCQQNVTLHVAGRTDAGVHAVAQVAHVDLDLPGTFTGYQILKAVNAHLIDVPVAVLVAKVMPDDFHARFWAVNKLYTYRIINRSARLALDAGRAWVVHPPLDIAAMRAGAAHLIGAHDFTTFRAKDCQAKSPHKTLDRLDIEAVPLSAGEGAVINIHAEARSFLHHQVRNMVGTLIQVGLGRWSADDVRAALLACDRARGGPTAPPDGLHLMRIDYRDLPEPPE